MAVRATMPVSETIWLDRKFFNLSVEEKLFFLYLLTNEHVERIGIYEVSLKTMAYETDLPLETVKSALQTLMDLDIVDYSFETDEVVILNYLKYSMLTGGKVGEKNYIQLGKKISDKRLLQRLYDKTVLVDDEREIFAFALNQIKATLDGIINPDTEIICVDEDGYELCPYLPIEIYKKDIEGIPYSMTKNPFGDIAREDEFKVFGKDIGNGKPYRIVTEYLNTNQIAWLNRHDNCIKHMGKDLV